MHSLEFFALLSALLITSVYGTQSTIELVLIVYRHGDRSPYAPYPTYNHASYWSQGLGQLTTIGIQQQYALGEFFRQQYTPGLFFPNYTSNQVYVVSTKLDRTIMSAQSQLAGLFPPSGDQIFKLSLAWQPVPVHVVCKRDINILRGKDAYCPEYKKLMLNYHNTKEYIEMSTKYADLLNTISTATHSTVTMYNIDTYIDTVFCDKQHNLSIPSWASDNYDTLIHLLNWTWKKYQDSREKLLLSGGRFLSEFWSKMDNKMNGSTPAMKAYFYSAHDSTLVTVTSALNIWNGLQPPYAAAIIAELIREENDWFIQFLYKNESDSPPYPLFIRDCGYKCPVERLRQLTADVTVTQAQWENKCGIETAQSVSPVGFNMVIIVQCLLIALLILTIIATGVFVCRKKFTPVTARYTKFTTDDSDDFDSQ